MSLYRAGKVGPSPPLGVAMLFLSKRREGSPNEPRLHSALTNRGDHCVNARPIPGARPRRSSSGQRRMAPLSKIVPDNFVKPAPSVRFRRCKTKGPHEVALLFYMVEVGGIEPPSASPTSMVLHA